MKKKTFIAILTLTLTAFIFTMLLTTCASTSKGSENMSEIILWNSGELNDRRINIKNENGQIVFPENGECYDLGWESKEMVIIYIPNGNYTLSHGSSYKEKFTTKGSVNISLNSNRARVHISGDISKTKVRVSKSAMPDVFGRINASALKAFKEINKSLKTTLPQTATIAIFPVTSNLIDRSELALESLTTHFVNAGYTVVEKRRLDELLAEYDFQRSGLVGEQTLGELLGADAVIFSNLDDNQNLRSIAVDVTKSTTLAKSMSDAKNIAQQYNMQIGQISGGTNNEAETINSFLASHNNILNTFKISNTGADIVVSGAMQQIGRKKKLLLTLHDPKNDIFRTDSLEYADALELWVKLQSIHGSSLYYMSSNLKSKYMKSDYATAHIKSQFGTGVNREEAEKFTQFFIFDAISFPYYNIRSFLDVTSSGSAPSNSTQVDFNWSKNGNRTRLDVSVGNQKYAIEYGSEEEFLTKMRGVTVFVVNKLNYPGRKNIKILGLDGYDLSTAFTPAPVSANFTKFNNVITRFGAPMGGFYIANSLVTQREYEAVMGQNPSVVKNPSQPVTNVNFRDAMIFCSQLSIRDGLDPFYIVNEFGPGDLHRDILHTVGRTNDNFSTGYRLAFLDEWEYAKDQITGMGTLPEYVNNIKSVFVGNTVTDNAQYIIKDNEPQTIGQTQGRDGNILPVIRLVRPIMDYWKFISGGVWDTNVKFFVIRN